MKASALCALIFAFAGGQSGPPADGLYARAEALLGNSDRILAGASSLHARYIGIAAFPSKFKDLRQTGTVDYVRPGKLRVAITRSRRPDASSPWQDTGNDTLRVGDGQANYAVFFHRYSTQARAERALRLDGEDETPLTVGFFGSKGTPHAVLQRAHDLGKLANLKVTDREVEFDSGADHYQVSVGANGVVDEFSRTQGSGVKHTWVLKELGLNRRIDDRTFAYHPPKDALPYAGGGQGDPLEAGDKAPEFVVDGTDGKPLKLSDFAGKVVVVKFWATWCWPCNQSMPETEKLAEIRGKDSVTTLAIAIKDSRSGFDHWVKAHPQYRAIRFAFEDPTRPLTSGAYAVSATPTTYVIGPNGDIVDRLEGFSGPDPRLDKAVAQAIGELKASSQSGGAGR